MSAILGHHQQEGLFVLLDEYRRNGRELLADSEPSAQRAWEEVCEELEQRVERLLKAARDGMLPHG